MPTPLGKINSELYAVFSPSGEIFLPEPPVSANYHGHCIDGRHTASQITEFSTAKSHIVTLWERDPNYCRKMSLLSSH